MKYTVRVMALLMCIVLVVAMFAGCGAEESTVSADAAVSQIETVEASETESEAVPAEAASEQLPAEEPASAAETQEPESLFVEVELPLVEERETLTMWWGGFDGGNFGNDHPGVTLMSQAAIEATNVEIEYGHCAGMEMDTQTALMFASGDWPDMIKGPSMYTGGLSAGVDEGVFMTLNDDLEEYSPNYYARITSDSDLYKQVTTDEGYLVKYYTLYDTPMRQNTGLIVRSDFLETLGMDAPVTYDDWYNMLTGFKNDLGLKEPFILDTSGMLDMLSAGYSVNSSWYQVDGTVSYAPVQEGFKEYLTMIAQWYAEGLIDENFMNNTVSDDRLNKIYDGNSGAYVDDYGSITSFKTLTEDPNFEAEAVSAPVKNVGDKTHFYAGGKMVDNADNGGIALSTNCSNVELCMRWMDFFYSLEGSLIFSYGVEGETYVDNGDGTYSYTEFITANPDWGITFAKLIYLDGCAGTGLHWNDSDIIDLDEGSLKAEEAWGVSDDDYVMPTFDLNGDDASTYSNLMGDIETYVDEMVLKFITGAESLDGFDAYVDAVYAMGLQEAIDLQQDGLDRYNAR